MTEPYDYDGGEKPRRSMPDEPGGQLPLDEVKSTEEDVDDTVSFPHVAPLLEPEPPPAQRTDPNGMTPVVSPGIPGERGKQGDRGQRGVEGDRGREGIAGVKGRSLSTLQALAIFLLIVLVGVTFGILSQRQQATLQKQQDAITANTWQIREANYQGCLGGVETVKQFNKQQTRLFEIEEDLYKDPQVTEVGKRTALARMKAYKAGIIKLPADEDKPCGDPPR